MSNAPRDGHTERIPSKVLDVILAKTRRKPKARRMIRLCMVDGEPYNAIALANNVSRQYVQEICLHALALYRATL